MRNNILLLATIGILAAANAADEFVAGELLVGFRPGTRGAQADAIRNGLGATKIKSWPEINAEHWRVPAGLSGGQAIQALSANPNVLYAEPNFILHGDAVPNDANRGEQWSQHNLGQDGGTPDADIDAPEAWELQHDASSVVVAVIDSGIDYTHPDLAPNMWMNPGETGTDSLGRDKATNGIDDDGNGYIDDWRGWDFVNKDNNPFDDYGHGTHVAGTIGAVGNNGIGVAGVAWSVQLMPLKILDATGNGPLDAGVSALLYAAKFVDASGKKTVPISNNSYGSGGTKSKTIENAIKTYAGLFVASAGNSGTSNLQYPAGYNLPNVIAVAATDRNDQLASYSNYGLWVHVAAPGSDIFSTVPNGTYGFKSGTSMASPHVSGVAALVLAQNPGWSANDLKAQLINAVDSLPVLAGKVGSGGRVNARRAVGASELQPDTTGPAAITDLGSSSASVTSITLSWTAPADDVPTEPAYFYQVRYGTSPITEAAFGYLNPIEIVPQNPGGTENYTVGGLQIGTTYYFAVTAVDEAGNASPMSNVAALATVDNGWRYMRLEAGWNMGNTLSTVPNSSGGWSITSDNNGSLRFYNYVFGNGYYNLETVGPVSGGASVAYDASWNASISYISAGKLLFAQKISGAWSSVTVDSRDVLNGDTSCLFDGSGAAWIIYPKGNRTAGVYAARRVVSSWTTQLIEKNGDGIYNQMALAPDGRPTVAYADDLTGDGKPDALKLAHFDGTSWSASIVDGVASGPVSLAYTPDGNPVIASRSGPNNELRFYLSTGSGWVSEVVDPTVVIQSCSIAAAANGTIWIAYATLTDMRAASRDPITGAWTSLVIDPDGPGTCRTALYLGATSGRPLTVYGGPAANGTPDSVRLAVKQP